MKPVQILIADDHEAIRHGIRSLLASYPEMQICGEASDGLEAVEKAMALKPDVVLMDISMPRMDGLAATRIVHDKVPGSHVIIVTQSNVAAVRESGVEADAFVSKANLVRDLVRTIEDVVDPSRVRNGEMIARTTDTETPAQVKIDYGNNRAGFLAAIVDSSDDAIVTKNLDGIVTSWNRAAERMFGYRAEEIIGESITRIIPPERMGEEVDIIARLTRGERVDHFETVRQRKDGSLVDISVTISPVQDPSGRVIGASKVARDITERKQVDKALEENQKRLQELAHDLETQVRMRTEELEKRNAEIVGYADQLRELWRRLQHGQDSERRRIARELHDSAGQLLAVLSLNLSQLRGQAGLSELPKKALKDSEQVVDQLSSEIRTMSYLLHPPLLDESGLSGAIRWYAKGLAERAGLEIALDVPMDFGRLPADMELTLFRIVQESLTNIHRHSGSKTASIKLSRSETHIALEVQDRGKGIPPAKLAGWRGQRMGVGITGMRERVRLFGGTIAIQSDERGTKVSVSLPLRDANASGSNNNSIHDS